MTADALNVLLFALFVVALLAGGTRTFIRMVARHRANSALPRLLWRDVACIGGMALSFGLLFGQSALNGLHWIDGRALSQEAWWVAIRALPGVVGAYVYAGFEFFVIGSEEE